MLSGWNSSSFGEYLLDKGTPKWNEKQPNTCFQNSDVMTTLRYTYGNNHSAHIGSDKSVRWCVLKLLLFFYVPILRELFKKNPWAREVAKNSEVWQPWIGQTKQTEQSLVDNLQIENSDRKIAFICSSPYYVVNFDVQLKIGEYRVPKQQHKNVPLEKISEKILSDVLSYCANNLSKILRNGSCAHAHTCVYVCMSANGTWHDLYQ